MTVNVGGGRSCSLSLLETTELCTEITGNSIVPQRRPDTRPGDVPLYLSDCARLFALTDWRPRHGPRQILTDTHEWIRSHETEVLGALP